ncbi:hypothetical protein GZ77_19180 [Endozoicomonas montiporae]|uniref:Lipoprotein n=2 Tax=Endozoicomonas montiporae TaxID=1027273 RepID=A0A081N2F1_9GAMM|nr:hypothetical protein [Endozoicomonas montiporae]AMO58410.1 hypothetical protein EZMO1_4495 [Endozoicomonas montiporae CL-33]KEQ12624.1 hypothetical protein GZ77_19180 [Endozoicomonas montiporae]
MRKVVSVGLLPAVAVLAILQGCSKPKECPKVAPVVDDSRVITAEESYDCSVVDSSNPLKQVWCEAKALFDASSVAADQEAFGTFLTGFRQGINDARRAEASTVSREALEGQNEKPLEAGYRAGYNGVVKQLGFLEYDCRDGKQASEYKDRWCEAEDAYRVAGVGNSDNPFLKGRFIDGYMAGGRVALTVPTSMESFFSGENPEGKQPAIFRPEGEQQEEQKATDIAFYRGFDEGYKAMIASIRESINQVMQQMQIPDNMQMPEGLMPPEPDQGQ